ncbi:MAG: sensor histidine kinase [Chitinophagaceae bacterium]|jgi:signal transduction histidine kinase|nr:sensor histidine kinase [Chitinophagaceae bacterium]
MKKYLSCLLAFLWCAALHGQNIDSLLKAMSGAKEDTNKVELLQELGNYYRVEENDVNTAKKYFAQSGQLSRHLNYSTGVYEYLREYSGLMITQDLYDSVLYYAEQMQALAIRENNTQQLALGTFDIGVGYGGKEQYDTSMQYFLKALSYFEATKDYNHIAKCYNALLGDCIATRQLDKAVEYGEKAIELCRQYAPRNVANPMSNLALVYTDMQQYDKAISLLKEALSIWKKNHDEPDELIVSVNLTDVYLKRKIKDQQVKELIDRTLFLAKKLEDWESLAEGFHHAGFYALLHQQYNKARAYADSSFAVVPATNKALKKDGYALLAKIAYANHDFEKGVYYDNKADSIQDASNTADINRSMVEMQTKYETGKKETLIKQLNAEKKVQQLLSQRRIVGLWILAGIVTLMIGIGRLWYRNAQRKQKLMNTEQQLLQQKITALEQEKQLLAAQWLLQGQAEERNRIAKDLHDGLGGLLSGVKLQLGAMKGNLILTEENGTLFNRALNRLDESISEMRRVAHNMMPEALIKLGLEQALQDYCDNINESQLLKINTVFMGLDKRLDESAEVILYRIVQELVNNIIKHSGATEMLVQVIRDHQTLNITVEDNGKGFDTEAQGATNGVGLQNIRSRVNYLRGKLDIQSKQGKGTSVYVECEIND